MLAELLSNDVFSGLAGGSLLLSGLYTLREVPERVGKWLTWQFSAEMRVYNDDAAFDHVAEWLSEHSDTRDTRRLRLTSSWSQHEQSDSLRVSPGIGHHLLWHGSRPILVERAEPKDGGGVGSFRRQETIIIRTLGRSAQPLRAVVNDVVEARAGRYANHVDVYLWRDYWRLASRKPKRSLESVVMPARQRARIVSDLERFTESREWYTRRGIPYRRGLLLHGPPGCGKTSFVLALAGYLGRRVYALNLGSLNGDEALIDAVSMVPENALLLIEDIDAAQADRSVSAKADDKKAERKPITMSGLLNCIDGVFSRDGRILVMTTNHPDKIDPALIRPGRADLQERIGEIGTAEVYSMCALFGDHDAHAEVSPPITPAELQQKLLSRRGRSEEQYPEAAE